MSGPHRNADKVNNIGIVVIGICGAVLVYVSIVALQAFYMSDTAEPNNIADYGGQDITARSLRSEQISSINEWQFNNSLDTKGKNTARISIDSAMKLVVDETTKDRATANSLVPSLGSSDVPLIQARFGRPVMTPPPSPAPAAGSGSAAVTPEMPAAGSGSAAGAGSTTAPTTPTGGTGPGGGPAVGSGAPSGGAGGSADAGSNALGSAAAAGSGSGT